ncbi:class I SAM-dependent methyltransferase [Aquabacterium soli]|uniref:Class I SAM-dependent methyltransferase n=1 Tax=Aquabacterium soli TaxID=2493092 RepID=A0A3R8U3F1_9BURK|nr:class I SAM-dependent methyltransferase [Aquabacterium soli]RRS03898.1 class I SAM-dependent methyltransferase [Aquabacterium soli]
MNNPALIHWTDADGTLREARWRAEGGQPAPRKVMLADDRLPADTAYKLACEGTALLWQGDFQNARHLLQALGRRLDQQAQRAGASSRGRGGKAPKGQPGAAGKPQPPTPEAAREAFHKHRQQQGHRARILGMLVLPFEADHTVPLRRAPDVQQACLEAYGPADAPYVASLRELLGLIGAHEWRKKGVEIPALGGRIHAHHGVFSPVRGEYVDLVASAPLPSTELAFDIGTGSAVLAAVLARRGVRRVVATDLSPRALACAQDNLQRLGLLAQVELLQADLFPPGEAPLVVCNPPWVPAKPVSAIEQAVYDPDSRMLRGFLASLRDHLTPGGEGWLVISDLAEHLGLRTRAELLGWIEAGGLRVIERLDIRPRHPKATDPDDPLHAARAAEITSLWRLGATPA